LRHPPGLHAAVRCSAQSAVQGILSVWQVELEQFLSFFDEGDEPTRVRTRAARPRRPATETRGPAPPDRQTARTRQAIALGGLIVLLILIVLGVNGCLNSRQENALKDYNRNVTAVVDDSDGSVGKEFFRLMADGARNSQDLQVQVNQLRLAADEDVKRAKAFDVPGDMSAAQRNLELVLNFRAEGLKKVADLIPSALGRGQPAENAIKGIAGEMQLFLASDVVHAERVAPLIKETLDDNGINGQEVAASRFMPDIAWLSPDTVGDRLGGTAGGTSGTSEPAPGLHGHGLLSTTVGDNVLQPTAPNVVNRVPASATLAFTVKFANQGDNDEKQVKVSIRVRGGSKNITQTKTIGQTKSKTESTVSIPLGQTPPVGVATTVTVAVAKVPGEENLTNNRSQYTVIFTR
jgi:hypothetical protein